MALLGVVSVTKEMGLKGKRVVLPKEWVCYIANRGRGVWGSGRGERKLAK